MFSEQMFGFRLEDGAVLPNEDSGKFQVLLDRLRDDVRFSASYTFKLPSATAGMYRLKAEPCCQNS